jgi:dTDP-4-amino-4,6-dideoxygalactose transaminase
MGKRISPDQPPLPVTDELSSRVLRLPFFHDITELQQKTVVDAIAEFFHE